MNTLQKYLSTCLLATAALLVGASPAFADGRNSGAASLSKFALLGSTIGGTNVTCTDGIVTGDVGVSPRPTAGVVPFTNTRCTVAGRVPPTTNSDAAQARTAFLSRYEALRTRSCIPLPVGTSNTLAGGNLAPGTYCIDAVAKTGTLTLTGGATGVWNFLVSGALTGNSFSVVMEGGGQPCNVSWVPIGAAATMTDSHLKGTILAGDAILGSITLNRGTLVGSALANRAVTINGPGSVIGCGALTGNNRDCRDNDDDDDDDDDDKHKDKERG